MSFGQNNYSMSFDGQDDYIEITNDFNSTNNYGVTFQFWAKSLWNQIPTSTGGNGSEEIIINFGDNVGFTGSYRYYILRSGANLEARCEGPGFSSSGTVSVPVSDLNISDNEWINISVIYNINGIIELYINGVIVATGNFTSLNNIIGLTDGLKVIGYNFGYGYHYTGKIDRLTYWNKPLTQQEIQQYMNCPPIGNEAGLVGFWNFEEGSGTTAYDLTSNGNDGTINGAAYSTDVPTYNCCTPNPIANQPVDQSVNIGDDANISFTDNLTGASYQWQMDSGTGFTDLSNAGQFSGSDSQSLTISSTTMNNNNTLYRCILTESYDCQDTTDVVTLTMINNVGIVELNKTPKQLIKIVDVLGRETPFKPNTPLLYIYDDGTVERKMIIE